MIVLDIYVRYEIKDNVIDFLLHNGYYDFFFLEAKKYAAKNMLLNDEEQVTGRQNYALIKIYLDENTSNSLAKLIEDTFNDARVFAVRCRDKCDL
ncbi:DUF3240 domain-containing protein [Helicobacter muridarum]|uniref:DUF3240 domain-containing protein n=1 Tax=Helicobacter muridarum TaxID=216 RepID=A0A099U0G0_9HELI|nr:DUF3240 family protein [Helicobacter muridarum]TLE00933.1 DUF3240 domain-containing protein [Helicobacter muridarum]STQ86712.1 Protein of uncharacterised function (DUF3240) [Helicobacter muridarum]